MQPPPQSQQPNEVENVVKELKKASGFSAYVIMNNDGIVIKYENMSYQTAVHHAALVLDLAEKSKKYARDLFQPSEVRKEVAPPPFYAIHCSI